LAAPAGLETTGARAPEFTEGIRFWRIRPKTCYDGIWMRRWPS